ncbi:MAG: class I SAM-dependent rRNA methyltransferase, partial [Petrotogales bacterium]
RLIYADADYLPGLIIDKYGDYLVLQFNIEGINKYKDAIVEIVTRLFNPKGIYQNPMDKTDEGNFTDNGWISGKGIELIPFEIDGLTYFADTLGQGTGFYLDQRENAEQLAKFAKEKNVLDLFSYTGNFAIKMLKQGATHAILVDNSKRALEVAREACKYNKVIDRTAFVNENVFEYIKNENIKENLVVLDPPPLGKTSKNKSIIMNGYNELSIRAINALPNDGILGTTCRSYKVKWSSWNKNINKAFIDTNSIGRLLYMGGQSIDFAPLDCIYETSYLKFNIYKIERF